jgi:SlyX protein
MPDDALLARIDALEIRVAYQDETIEELNTALAAQWQEIDRLRHELALLQTELREATEGVAAAVDGAPEPPPPHY